MMSEEIFDICDEQDRVVGQAPRGEVHARKLWHRAVHIFVFRPSGELLVHLRSATKDEYPLCYTSSASGHVGSGESYELAAFRELEEELGLRTTLEFLHKFPASPQTSYEHTVLYRAVTDAVPRPDPTEIAEIAYWNLDELACDLAAHRERYSPCFATLFAWYHARQKGVRE